MLALLLVSAPASAQPPQIAFATRGGDAWSFRKEIEADVIAGACEEVAITSAVSREIETPHSGRVRARLKLLPGRNRIQAECYHAGKASGPPIVQDWNVRLADVPRAWIRVAATGNSIVLDGESSTRAPAQHTAITLYQWREAPGNPAPLRELPARGSRVVLSTPEKDGEYRVTLTVADRAGQQDQSTAIFRIRNGRPETINLVDEHSSWIDDAVIYGVAPKLFGRNGLADVTAQLDRLAALGVNTIWLSPITDAPDGDFGYAATSLFKVRANLGGEAALHAFIAAAHARGMHVILDFVSNDLSDRNPYFADAAANGNASPYYDFFQRAAGAPVHYFDWRNLENLNYRNSEVQRLVIEAFAYWVREYHVDGFRVDAAWGVRLRDPEFWPRWRSELKRINPDLLLIAEGSARDTYYRAHGFDAAYDWTDQPGHWAWQQAFDDPTQTAQRLEAAIAADPGTGVLRFLDNNDTGPRFVTRYGVARARVAAAMLMTLPGLPALYAGDEVGAAYQPYVDARPLAWNDPDSLQAWYQRLIALRRGEPALRSGALHFLDVAKDKNVLAYLRSGNDNHDRILVLLNYNASPSRVTVSPATALPQDGVLVDLLSGARISAAEALTGIALDGYGVRLIKIEESSGRK